MFNVLIKNIGGFMKLKVLVLSLLLLGSASLMAQNTSVDAYYYAQAMGWLSEPVLTSDITKPVILSDGDFSFQVKLTTYKDGSYYVGILANGMNSVTETIKKGNTSLNIPSCEYASYAVTCEYTIKTCVVKSNPIYDFYTLPADGDKFITVKTDKIIGYNNVTECSETDTRYFIVEF